MFSVYSRPGVGRERCVRGKGLFEVELLTCNKRNEKLVRKDNINSTYACIYVIATSVYMS